MNKLRIVACVICQLLYNMFNVFFAWVIMQITDSLVNGESSVFVNYLGIAGIGVGCQILFHFLSFRLQNKIVNSKMTTIRTKSLYGVLKGENRFLQEIEKAQYVAYFTNELEIFENSYLRMQLNIINSIILLVLSGGMIFQIHRTLLLIVVAMMALMVLIPFGLSGALQKANAAYLCSNKELIKKTEEFLNGYEVIKSFFIENKIVHLYEKTVKWNSDNKKRFEDKMGISNVITGFMSILIILSTFIVGGYLILQSVLTVGALLAVIQLISNMISPLTDILYGINEMNSVKEIKDKVRAFCEKADERDMEMVYSSIGSKLEIENLSFTYPEQDAEAIKRVDLVLEKGKTYAVVGENGCGKSTFAKIISGYYTNYSGKIKINGEDMKKIPGNKIRSRIVYINQKDFLFDAFPEENCTLFFNYEINPALVSAMGSDELLEKDYSTTMMSGGERQKIAFLRGFSRKSDVLICDEAESAMDILAKKRFIDLLKNDKERIKVSITHTIDDSLKEYDTILYFNNGILAEQGSFDELCSKKEEFYKFYSKKVV